MFPLKTNQRMPLLDQTRSLRSSIYLEDSSGEECARPREISSDDATIVHNYEMCCDSKGYAIFLLRRTMQDGNERSQSVVVCEITLPLIYGRLGASARHSLPLLMSLSHTHKGR